MIKLQKGAQPAVLAKHTAAWTEELIRSIEEGGDSRAVRASRYANKEVKDALAKETHKKCAYCECKPLAMSYGDVEHISPKALNPALAYEWTNLTLACDKCNTKKGDKEGLIDPYTDDPEAEFIFLGPWMTHRAERFRAERTVAGLELNRADLIERRQERLADLRRQLDRLDATANAAHRAFLKAQIREHETAESAEFAACVRGFVAAMTAHGLL